ncbi:MAG: amidophosphoribosyltransferase [Euryarchaeota archaeon]|nr:amidophosphoribosyltransferase [Euryarchaeota archaeon]
MAVPMDDTMGDSPKHFCGIVAMSSNADVKYDIKKALRVIQHRGQEATGIAIHDGNSIKYVRRMGLVHEVLIGPEYDAMGGNIGIGHVRYSTTGTSCAQDCQPIVVTTNVGDAAIGHNGDLVNAAKLRTKLQNYGWAFLTNTDSEIIIRMLATELTQNSDPIKAIRTVMRNLDGAYALVFMVGKRVFGARDPLGLRPLCIGKLENGYSIASESAVFDILQGDFVRDVAPGEIVEITPSGFTSHQATTHPHTAHCMFEWVYFARPDSIIDGREVYDVRKKLGQTLAREQPVIADVVIPVPDSGRANALGYAQESGIMYEEGLMKNRYVERTFILPDQSKREEGVSLKLNPIRSTIVDKRVVVVDDSIVRGTTLRKIVQMLRHAGAKEVHVRIGCPPIIAPCYYGVDMKTRDYFIAAGRTFDEIAELIGADSVGYTSVKGLRDSLDLSEQDLCMACLTAEYPTCVPGERMRFQKTLI